MSINNISNFAKPRTTILISEPSKTCSYIRSKYSYYVLEIFSAKLIQNNIIYLWERIIPSRKFNIKHYNTISQ